MFDAWLRALKDRAFAGAARRLGAVVHPNVVTVLACLVGLLAAWAAADRRYDAALALWVLNRLLDGLDGSIARERGRASDVGGYLDVLLDHVVYAAVPIGLAVGVGTREALVAALLLLATFYVNAASWMYLSAVLERRGRGAEARGERTSVTMPPGLVAGAETAVLYALFLLLPEHLVALFTLMAVLVLLTVAQRLAWARRSL